MTAKRKNLPSARLLRKLIDYDPETGTMRWKERPAWMFSDVHYGRQTLAGMWNKRYAGREAFTAKNADGYNVGRLFDGGYLAHRIAWRMHTGEDAAYLDHINGSPGDNRIVNLRAVTNMENLQNCKMSKTNKSGVTGVSWARRERKWKAQIKFAGRNYYLGDFKTLEEAASVRKAAEMAFGFHPNHGRCA